MRHPLGFHVQLAGAPHDVGSLEHHEPWRPSHHPHPTTGVHVPQDAYCTHAGFEVGPYPYPPAYPYEGSASLVADESQPPAKATRIEATRTPPAMRAIVGSW
jgi:hypothetical protein